MAKHLKLSALAHSDLTDYIGGEDPSKVVRRVVKAAKQSEARSTEKIALVILEDSWWDLDENPRQASSGPFLDGLSRFLEQLTPYRFNFYDTKSFSQALTRALTVPEQRVILYIGAHGSKKKIGGAHLSTILDRLSKKSESVKKIEGVILSSCMAAGNDDAMPKAFDGKTHWLFGYSASIDWLGSILIETAILESICLSPPSYCDSTENLLHVFHSALTRFNSNWLVGEDVNGTEVPLKSAISFWVRAKHGQKAQMKTEELIKAAWPSHITQSSPI